MVRRDARIADVLRVLEREWSSPPTVAELAARVNLSRPRLQHLFRQHVGMSVRRFIAEKRLTEAAKLLTATHLRVSEVGYRVGFESPSAFNHAFVARFGVPPGAYRQHRIDADARASVKAAGASRE